MTRKPVRSAFCFFVLCLSLLLSLQTFSQWTWLNPRPSSYTNNKIVFVDRNTGYILNSNGDLYKTTNQGSSWQQAGAFPNTLAMEIKDSTGVIAGSYGVLYLSADKGNSWKQLYTGISESVTMINIISKDTIFLTSNYYYNSSRNIYKTTDGGKTWITLRSTIPVLSITFVNSNIGYVGGVQSTILKTLDGGVTWKQLKTSNTIPSSILSMQFLSPDTGFAFMEFSNLLRTYDGGATWQSADAHETMPAMHFINTTDGYLGGSDGAMYATHDGGKTFSWIGFDGLIDGHEIYSVYFLSKDTGFAVGAQGRIIKTVNAGTTWTAYGTFYLPVKDLTFPSAAVGYAVTGNTIYKTVDKGQTWKPLNFTVGTQYGSQKAFEKTYFLNPDTGFVTSSNQANLHRTFDGGLTWDAINPLRYGYEMTRDIQFITPKIGFMSWVVSYGGTILKTKDAGITWDTVWNSRFYGERFDHLFYLNEDTGFAINYNQLYKTTNGSKTWQKVNLTTESYALTNVVFTTRQKGFVTDDYCNIYVTNDGGTSWKQGRLPTYYSGGILAMKFINPQIGYLTADNASGPGNYGYIYKTVDSGATWTLHKNVGGKNIFYTPDSSVVISGFAGSILSSKVAGFTVLPVTLSGVNASYTKQGPLVSWTVMSDQTSNYFEIERSTDGINFIAAGRVKAQPVSSETYYHFVDTASVQGSSGAQIYRIKTVDLDGSFSYSRVLKVEVPQREGTLGLSPNPASGSTVISFGRYLSDPVVSLFDVQGRRVTSVHLAGSLNLYKLSTAALRKGLYTVVVEGNRERFTGKLMIVQ